MACAVSQQRPVIALFTAVVGWSFLEYGGRGGEDCALFIAVL